MILRPFNSIEVISGRLEVDNDRLCAMKPRLQMKDIRLPGSSKPEPLDQQASK